MSVRRVAIDSEYDYASAFELSTVDSRPAEDWARATFEGAPGLIRRLLVLSWSVGLGLRLGPRPSREHVLGWSIIRSNAGSVELAARSRLMAARNVVDVTGSTVRWTTTVQFTRWPGRILWVVAAPIHHLVIARLLGRAGRTPYTPRSERDLT
jgi:uncharacterized protein DUF2867